MPTTLLVRIYTASPLEIGEIMKMPAMEMGMIFIMACCCGSVAVIGVIFETRYTDTPSSTGKMHDGTFAERPRTHSKVAGRVPMAELSAVSNPTHTGLSE